MPRQKPWSAAVSWIVTFSALAAMVIPMGLAASDPTLPIGLAILAGIALGVPLLILGARLHPDPRPTERGSNRFWPTRTEWWGILGLLTLAGCYLAPAGLVVLLFCFMPPGDQWGMAIVRTVLIIASACGAWWWITLAKTSFPELFRGRMSDETLDAYKVKASSDEPSNTFAAVLTNWHLAVVAITALLVICGIINFNFAGLNPAIAPRKLRGLVRLLIWCRGNPNTTMLLAGSVGLGALVLYAYRVLKVYFRTNSGLSDSMHRDELQGDLPKGASHMADPQQQPGDR